MQRFDLPSWSKQRVWGSGHAGRGNAGWRLRRDPEPAAPGAGGSSRVGATRAKSARGSSTHGSSFRLPGRSAPASTVRCESPRRGRRPAEQPPVAAGQQRRAAACVRAAAYTPQSGGPSTTPGLIPTRGSGATGAETANDLDLGIALLAACNPRASRAAKSRRGRRVSSIRRRLLQASQKCYSIMQSSVEPA